VTLRLRLSLAFALVALTPVLVAAVVVAVAAPRLLNDATSRQVHAGQRSAVAVLAQYCQRARAAAAALAQAAAPAIPTTGSATRGSAGAGSASAAPAGPERTATAAVLDAGLADLVRLQRPGARDVTAQVPGATLAADVTLADCRDAPARAAPGVIAARAALPGGGSAWAALVLDRGDAVALEQVTGVEITFLATGRALASSLSESADVRRAEALSSRADTGRPQRFDGVVAIAQPPLPGVPVGFVASAPAADTGWLPLVLLAVLAAVVAPVAMLANRFAAAATSPLNELTAVASRVAAGDLDITLPVRRDDEVGRLATAFNTMTTSLRAHVDALRDRRDVLRLNLGRLGVTMSSTHDLARIVEVILDTSMTSTNAGSGAVFLVAAGRGEVHLKAGMGPEQPPSSYRLPFGLGVAGRVAETGEPVSGRLGADPGQLHPAPGEPQTGSVLAVPLKSQGRVLGVVVLYHRLDAETFDDGDRDTMHDFAGQAAVAVHNVLLHQETARLSITDALTGLWNYRYFTMQLGKEIERASRFGRPLSLLMLDLDHFKSVNDTYGHPRGDAVLVELANRIRAQIREVDTFARYGGEELVLLLPETDATGAALTAARVCQVVRSRTFGREDEPPLTVTASAGVAVFPTAGVSAGSLLRAADEALYDAKRAGRDRWSMSTRVGDGRDRFDDLRLADRGRAAVPSSSGADG